MFFLARRGRNRSAMRGKSAGERIQRLAAGCCLQRLFFLSPRPREPGFCSAFGHAPPLPCLERDGPFGFANANFVWDPHRAVEYVPAATPVQHISLPDRRVTDLGRWVFV